MNRNIIFLLVFGFISFAGHAADNDAAKNGPRLTWDLLWTGSWDNSFKTVDEALSPELVFQGGTLINRAELKLGIPGQNLVFRLQGVDKRKFFSEDDGLFSPGFGIYFNGSSKAGNFLGNYIGNSRLLYGILNENGLPARLRNIWAKSPPYAEYRVPFSSDLRIDPSSTLKPETYLYLGFPKWNVSFFDMPRGELSGFVSVQIDNEFNPAFGSGVELRFDKNTAFKLDGFYTQRLLHERNPSTWFSLSPPLPEREFHFFALGTAFDSQDWGLAADLGFSETFAWGRDLYANAAFRLGSKPWKFSFSAEAAGSRFVGQDGNSPGAGFRIAGRAERQWIRSGLFRVNAVLRSPGLGEDFQRSSFDIYFRPSAPLARSNPFFRFTRASLSLSRNAVNPLKTEDSLNAVLAFNISGLRFVFTGNIHSLTALNQNELFLALPLPSFFDQFQSAEIASEVSWNIGDFQFSAKAGYEMSAKKDAIWDFSLNSSLRIKNLGRFSLKIAAPQFPDKWSYALSWRLERKF